MKRNSIYIAIAAITMAAFTGCSEKEDNNGNVLVSGVTLSPATANLTTGSTLTLTATVMPENATNKAVSWTSSNTTVATVTNGTITAITPGTATITVTTQDGNKTATCEVSVLNVVIAVESITLSETNLSLVVGETETLTATVLPADATDKSVTWTSSNTTVASVTNGVVTANAVGTATITAKAGDKTATCAVSVINNPLYDEGIIINNVKWATRNVDAFGTFASAPESTGMFYQWNRPTAWAATGTVTGWDSSTPTGTTWESANNPCPAGWRVPTRAEIESLLDTEKVTSEWTTLNGIKGRRFTDKTTNNTIFLPAAGCRYHNNGTLLYVGEEGYYWSRQYHNSNNAYFFYFDNYGSGWGYIPMANGFSVRPVAE